MRTCHDNSGSLDLVLTDIMMPGRLGGDLAVMLRETCKDLRVLFMSAHPPADLQRLGRIEAGAALLTKPFDMRTLGLSVHKLLHEPPAESPSQAATSIAAASKAKGAAVRKRIMIVDDDPDVAESLRLFLEFDGQDAAVANSGGQALEMARKFEPHVILCDLNLGSGMNGYDVARALRQTEAGSGCYVVALTGSEAGAVRDKAQEAGFDLVMTKPVDPSRLEQIISSPAGAST